MDRRSSNTGNDRRTWMEAGHEDAELRKRETAIAPGMVRWLDNGCFHPLKYKKHPDR